MKREGRQRGMVKTHTILPAPWNPRPSQPSHPVLGLAPTAGQFTKVSTKPTNHSKFTGKCGRPMCHECRFSPVSKSKDKVKGAQRLRSSSDMVSNYKSITWKVVYPASYMRVSGFSATSILDYLDNDDYTDRCYGDDDEDHNGTRVEESDYEISYPPFEIEEMVECEVKNNEINGEDNEDEMSFCDVGLFWQLENGDEDWYLV
ncbi:hypothetical protein C2S53_009498 [Perilla frutescens var. hirtella]|uniref:Uncharacterized protein n=1 Tax=Perilla frutescens var. hirtella TaxID=608512 RepID=A0AAD4JDR9_PERFH|nr:hypothetical protein C2S53_009498 [Perilla frutescens var. hirtella]